MQESLKQSDLVLFSREETKKKVQILLGRCERENSEFYLINILKMLDENFDDIEDVLRIIDALDCAKEIFKTELTTYIKEL